MEEYTIDEVLRSLRSLYDNMVVTRGTTHLKRWGSSGCISVWINQYFLHCNTEYALKNHQLAKLIKETQKEVVECAIEYDSMTNGKSDGDKIIGILRTALELQFYTNCGDDSMYKKILKLVEIYYAKSAMNPNPYTGNIDRVKNLIANIEENRRSMGIQRPSNTVPQQVEKASTNNSKSYKSSGILYVVVFILSIIAIVFILLITEKNHQRIQEEKEREEQIQAYENTYIDNSLQTGDQPYSEHYGIATDYSGNDYSIITVTAPSDADAIFTIKSKNDKGPVVFHAYLCKNTSYSAKVKNGTYQVFFYLGKGWDPQRKVGSNIGGFVKNFSISKDDPQNLSYNTLTYVLKLTQNGNFHDKPSNVEEAF